MNEETKVRYIQWNQHIDKLTEDMDAFNVGLSEKEISDADSKIENYTQRLKKLRAELEDIMCWEEVDDFLENGSGLLTDGETVVE